MTTPERLRINSRNYRARVQKDGNKKLCACGRPAITWDSGSLACAKCLAIERAFSNHELRKHNRHAA